MSSIQNDTKNLLNWLFTISSTTSNCQSFQAICNEVFHYVRLIDAVRILNTYSSKVKTLSRTYNMHAFSSYFSV